MLVLPEGQGSTKPTPARYRQIAAKPDSGESLEPKLAAFQELAGGHFSHCETQLAFTCLGGFDPSELCEKDGETLIRAATAL